MSELPGAPIPEQRERGDLDDPTKVGRRGTWQRIDDRKDKEAIAFILSSQEGRRFYWKLMCECGIFKSSFTGNNTTFFNEGERNIGLKLLARVNELMPEAYVTMLRESKQDERNKEEV